MTWWLKRRWFYQEAGIPIIFIFSMCRHEFKLGRDAVDGPMPIERWRHAKEYADAAKKYLDTAKLNMMLDKVGL